MGRPDVRKQHPPCECVTCRISSGLQLLEGGIEEWLNRSEEEGMALAYAKELLGRAHTIASLGECDPENPDVTANETWATWWTDTERFLRANEPATP